MLLAFLSLIEEYLFEALNNAEMTSSPRCLVRHTAFIFWRKLLSNAVYN